ncbi:hypothetical protein GY45DRAFT_1245862 [Cubamyces sp. BRFM 1775]|nr:hypothetical protein GY45DRAFT_1245862 [Cubamyces sp. BRFM 1775]
MTATKVLIPLDDTVVVCLGEERRVVQITCKSERPNDISTITTYYLVRHEISELILRLVMARVRNPIPSPLIVEAELYSIQAQRVPWNFGKKVAFMWGENHLKACEEKWTFLFTARRISK